MSPLLIGLLAGGGLGLLSSNKKIKEKAEQDKFRKVAIAMSPWTGMGDPGTMATPDMLAGAASGAFKGGMAGSMFPAAGVGGAAELPITAANDPAMQQASGMSPAAFNRWMLINQ